ncbi:hypothetical protein [Saccharomonospora sp. CUA-673]|uniref:hypothetical protein n=1 Tax=Saccharomonospora sp. CUA-673 TaxID=1904969 RepID=UPI0035185208
MPKPSFGRLTGRGKSGDRRRDDDTPPRSGSAPAAPDTADDGAEDQELSSYLKALAPDNDLESTGSGRRFGDAQVYQLRMTHAAGEQLSEVAAARNTSPQALALEWVLERLAWEAGPTGDQPPAQQAPAPQTPAPQAPAPQTPAAPAQRPRPGCRVRPAPRNTPTRICAPSPAVPQRRPTRVPTSTSSTAPAGTTPAADRRGARTPARTTTAYTSEPPATMSPGARSSVSESQSVTPQRARTF